MEQLKNTPTKIYLWDLIQASPNYHNMLQNSLQKVIIPPSVQPNNVASLIQCMNSVNIDIVFHQNELPPMEIQKQNEAFMVMTVIKKCGIKSVNANF